jgi:hypothetical protein
MGEKSYQGMNQKFVYDIQAKALVSHFAYQPFAMERVLNVSGRTVFVGTDLQKLVAVEFRPGGSPEFRILAKGEAAPWLARRGTGQDLLDDSAPIRFGEAEAFTFASGSIVDRHGKKYLLHQSRACRLQAALDLSSPR